MLHYEDVQSLTLALTNRFKGYIKNHYTPNI